MTGVDIMPQWARLVIAFTPPVGALLAIACVVRAAWVTR